MPRFHRRRTVQLLCYLLALASISYLLVRHEAPISIVEDNHKDAQHEAFPTYEYISDYRVQADHAFENQLEAQLLDLENATRHALPKPRSILQASRTIWQIASPREAEAWRSWNAQWPNANPEWSYQLYSSLPDDLLEAFESIPNITSAIKDFPTIRQDLQRYMLLWYNGGLYADINTWDRVALGDCFPTKAVLQKQREISLMIGVDTDEPYLSRKTIDAWQWTRGFGFGLSVMWAPTRFDPLLRKAIVRSISHAHLQKNCLKHAWGDVIPHSHRDPEVSGPGMFTDVVLEALSNNLEADDALRDRDAGLERRVTWKRFRALKQPIWIEADPTRYTLGDELRGLAVLPINIWGSGQHHSRSGSTDDAEACINRVHGWKIRKTWREKVLGF